MIVEMYRPSRSKLCGKLRRRVGDGARISTSHLKTPNRIDALSSHNPGPRFSWFGKTSGYLESQHDRCSPLSCGAIYVQGKADA